MKQCAPRSTSWICCILLSVHKKPNLLHLLEEARQRFRLAALILNNRIKLKPSKTPEVGVAATRT
jgi:hypothetical protein